MGATSELYDIYIYIYNILECNLVCNNIILYIMVVYNGIYIYREVS